MRALIPTLIALAALLSAPSTSPPADRAPGQDSPHQDQRRAAPLPALPSPDPRLAKLAGAWELARVDSPGTRDLSFRHSGMMLLTGGFLSIELHLGMIEVSRTRSFETYFQSGVHRVEIDAFDQLVLVSVLGAEVDERGELRFEEPGQRRLYRYELIGDELVLTNLQRQARLTFRRVLHDPPQRDIYGREVRRAPADEEGE